MTTSAPALSPVSSYAHAVISGESIACKWVRLACERHMRDLERAEAGWLYYFDDATAEWAINFFRELLKHSKGEWAGQALKLAPWQCFIVGSLFGWKRRDNDTRRFRESYTEVPRKNGKSTMAAGIGILLAFFDEEPAAEVYAAATKRDQAKIIWGEAKQMVLASPNIRRRIRVLVGNLSDTHTASKFEPLGADADSMDGLNIHGRLIDELHAHKTRAMWDVLQTATGARRQPLGFIVTTAGSDRSSVCYEQHHYAEQVLGQIIDDETFFAYMATIDEGDDYTDPRTWAKANPNYGISVKIDDLERKCRKAFGHLATDPEEEWQQGVPGDQNAFLRLHLDVWTEQATRWLSTEMWDEGKADPESLTGRACYAGLVTAEDGLSALSLWFPDGSGGGDAVTSFFIPGDNIGEQSRQSNTPLGRWASDGWIEETEGNVVDYELLRTRLNALNEQFEIREVAVRQHNTTQLMTQLMGDGLTVVPINRGFPGMSAATKEVERLLTARKLRHGGHPVLRWMASNIAIRQDADGEKRPDRENSCGSIVGLEALIIAVARAMVQADACPSGM